MCVCVCVCVYENRKAMDRWSHEDIDFLVIVTGVLQFDTLIPYTFVILDYLLRTNKKINQFNKRRYFSIIKTKSRQYPAETLIDADILLANTPAQVKSLRHSQLQAAKGIGPQVNANKTELMCFEQEATISILEAILWNSRPFPIPWLQYHIDWRRYQTMY